jgi:DNA polymerase II small subunit
MSETEKLQKAVALTIAAGYQLDKEAFEFLKLIAAGEDLSKIMDRALKKIAALSEKPLFIDRVFLENLLEEQKPAQENAMRTSEKTFREISTPQLQVTEDKRPFHPYASEVESNINIIDDPGSKLVSGGTIEDYLGYFRDRYRRIERLLRQRMDVKSAASIIDVYKASANARLKIICMVTDKRESKQRIILSVEDLHANATVLVPQNASQEVQKRARTLMLDQVVCLSVVKTRGNLLIAEDIVLPDIAQRKPHKAPVPVYAALTSDMHVGSTQFQRDNFNHFILWLNGKYGNERMREIASNVKYVLIAGDVVDGVGVYPNQMKELVVRDVYKQYKLAAKYLEQIPDYIDVIVTPGNHDAPRKALPQPPISHAHLEVLQESKKVYSLGDPCTLSLHGVDVLMFHGRSLDDIVSTIPDMTYNHPEKTMKLLLQGRHLAPLYGGKTPLAPESRDSLVIERVPDIFHAGHVHTLGYDNYRGVLVVNSGCWQEQTEYMRRNGFVPDPGKVPVVNLQTLEVTTVSFN